MKKTPEKKRFFTVAYYNAIQFQSEVKIPEVYEFAKEVETNPLGGVIENPIFCVNLGMNGEPKVIRYGDWLVTDDDGVTAVLTDMDFRSNFFPASRLSRYLTGQLTVPIQLEEMAEKPVQKEF